jgi:hypothetical protein
MAIDVSRELETRHPDDQRSLELAIDATGSSS